MLVFRVYHLYFEQMLGKIYNPLGTYCAPLVAVLFCLALEEISCCRFLTIINQILLKLLTYGRLDI